MAQLEEITKDATLRGILPQATVTIVDAKWHGSDVVEAVYKGPDGSLGNELLFRDREPSLEVVKAGRPWSFTGDGNMLRLVSEAHRIRLAYLFDPVLAVHTSLVEPLPHQITAVYEEMLTRQPLRFMLADDPGAGKTIMAGLFIKELLVRGDVRRCMIVAPGNLVEQWQDELNEKFQLPFEIMTNDQFESARTGNWFEENPLVVCRLDKLSRNSARLRQCLAPRTPGSYQAPAIGERGSVDLAQASIGPGMAVFSRYRQVVNADGSPMSVREALQMINQVLDESLVEQESDFDSETRFALRWFEQYGMQEGPFGDAETLAKAMAVSVTGVSESGVINSRAGKVRLLRRDELDADWSLQNDERLTNWEVTQQMILALETGGETAAAELLAAVHELKGSEYGEYARELAYRLYSTCERKDWAAEARSYNGLVVSWPEIIKLARAIKDSPQTQQKEMF